MSPGKVTLNLPPSRGSCDGAWAVPGAQGWRVKNLSSSSSLHRSFAQVLELSAQASKEAALINQEVWEEAQGSKASSQWYFNPEEATGGETRGEPGSLLLLGHDEL